MTERDRGAIALAERVMSLLDQGSFSATYEYALLLALLDLCLEKTTGKGLPPESVTTRQRERRDRFVLEDAGGDQREAFEPAAVGGTFDLGAGLPIP